MTKVECQAIALSSRICLSPISILLLLEISTIKRTFSGQQCLAQALSSVCQEFLNCITVHKYIYFIRNVMLSRKRTRVSTKNWTFNIVHCCCSNLIDFQEYPRCTISKNILERTISQERPRTHYHFDEIYEAHESSFVCIKPLNK